MASKFAFIILLAIVCCAVPSLGKQPPVEPLGREELTAALNRTDKAVVVFSSPLNGESDKIIEEIKDFVTSSVSAGIDASIAVYKVDGTAEVNLARAYGVDVYPTVFLYRLGTFERYEGPVKIVAEVLKWIASSELPTAKTVPEAEVLSTQEDWSVTIALYQDVSSAEYPIDTFYEVSKIFRDSRIRMVIVSYDSANKNDEAGAVMLYHREETDYPRRYNGPVDDHRQLKMWVDKNHFPFFPEIDSTNYDLVLQHPTPMCWVCVEDESEFRRSRSMFLEIAQLYPETQFLWINVKKFDETIRTTFGLQSLPAVVYTIPEEKIYSWTPSSLLNKKEEMVDFINKARQGKASRVIRSQPAEINDSALPLKRVVGNTFAKMVVYAQDKDVFVQFYASWCAHSRAMQPHMEALAESLKLNDHVVVAQMEASENDVIDDNFPVPHFPIIYWRKIGETAPTVYTGKRSVLAMSDFIKGHSSQAVTVHLKPAITITDIDTTSWRSWIEKTHQHLELLHVWLDDIDAVKVANQNEMVSADSESENSTNNPHHRVKQPKNNHDEL